MEANDGVALVQTIKTISGPGSAELASSWASDFGLSDVQVWGDTSDYIAYNFAGAVGWGYPFTIVVDIDTMEITHLGGGDVSLAQDAVDAILADPHPCAE